MLCINKEGSNENCGEKYLGLISATFVSRTFIDLRLARCAPSDMYTSKEPPLFVRFKGTDLYIILMPS